MGIISSDINRAAEILSGGGVIAIPTETVYGLAGNIFNEKAIERIFSLKDRPHFNPLIVHIHSISQLDEIVEVIPDKAKKLAEKFWPGPLTLILKKKSSVPDLVTAGKDTVAVRVPDHEVTLELLKDISFPLAAPSANPFGNISPTSSKHVEDYFGKNLEMVLEGGECRKGIESTIVGFENEKPIIFRLGSVSVEEIINEIGPVEIKNKKEQLPDAPGMLSRHYAPKTRTYLVEKAEPFLKKHQNKKIGLILFDRYVDSANVKHLEILSINSDLDEAASNLYAALHRLDQLKLDMIVAERFPEKGLGRSVNDRLSRATQQE